jgi:protoporphyrinogen/coproporphyrinogen III oxidase
MESARQGLALGIGRMNSVAIIGAGMTGLTAAFRLQRENIPVTVYEAASRVGGPIQTMRSDGFLAECGPNSILETNPAIGRLIQELGLESQRVNPNPEAKRRYIVRGGKLIAAPDSPPRFFATGLFSGAAKLRLLREPFIRRCGGKEESLANFVRRRLGQEFLDYAINPFVGGVYAGDPEKLSVQEAFPKLAAVEERYGSLILGQILGARERKQRGEVSKQRAPMFSFLNGLETLPQALATHLGEAVRIGNAVKRIHRTELGWEVTSEGKGKACHEEHSAVLLAIGAHQLARLPVQSPGVPDLSPLKEIEYPAVASVTLGFSRSTVKHPLDGFGVLVPQAEKMNILGTIFGSSLFPNRSPEHCVTLTTFLGGSRSPTLAALDQGELIETVLGDLRRLLGVSGRVTFSHVRVFPEAIPQYNVGYGRFKHLMAEAEVAAPGLFIAGNSRCGISLGDSIMSGHRAAERIENFLSRSDRRLGQNRLAHFESI